MNDYKSICDELKSIYSLNDYMLQQHVKENVRRFQYICGEAADVIESLQSKLDFYDNKSEGMMRIAKDLLEENKQLKKQLNEYNKFDRFLMVHVDFEK